MKDNLSRNSDRGNCFWGNSNSQGRKKCGVPCSISIRQLFSSLKVEEILNP